MPGREGNWAEDGGRDGGQEMIKFRNVLMDLRWGDIEESKISTESGPSHWKDGVIINRLGDTVCLGGWSGLWTCFLQWLAPPGGETPDGQWVQERGVLPLCTEMTCESPPEEVRGRAETSIFGLRRSQGTLSAGGGPDRSGAAQTSERKLRTVGWSHEEDILQ